MTATNDYTVKQACAVCRDSRNTNIGKVTKGALSLCIVHCLTVSIITVFHWQRAILHGIMMQYNGKNNGNLCATSTMAKDWGVKSRATLIKSLKELEDKRFLIRTRQGVFMSSKTSCTLFALSWEELNEIDTINFDDHVKANLKFKQIIER